MENDQNPQNPGTGAEVPALNPPPLPTIEQLMA